MKHTFIKAAALAVVMVPGAVMAQEYSSDLNASLRFGLGLETEPDADIFLRNYGSRIRWSGNAQIDDSRSLSSYLEFGFDQDEGIQGTRQAWIGYADDWGSIKAGKQYSALYDAVTSNVDVAYWGSCALEIACSRESSIIKYSSAERDGMQWLGSVRMVNEDEGLRDSDLLNGLELAAKIQRGNLNLGAGLSYIDDQFTDGGVALALSATQAISEGTGSVMLTFASDDYVRAEDPGLGVTAAFSRGNIYAVAGIFDSINTPLYLTAGYVKELIADRALVYTELGLSDDDAPGSDIGVEARAVLIFNFGIRSGA